MLPFAFRRLSGKQKTTIKLCDFCDFAVNKKRKKLKQDEITQIRIANFAVGIRGLKSVMEEMAGEYGDSPDGEVMEELLARLRKMNCIPKSVETDYAEAFLKEFRKSLGQPYEEEDRKRGLEIKVLGPGCARCDGLEREIMNILSEMNIQGDIEHIRDVKEIGKYGVMGTPALIINGTVKAVGNVPPKNKLIELIKEALDA